MSGVSQATFPRQWARNHPFDIGEGPSFLTSKSAASTVTIHAGKLMQHDTTIGANLFIKQTMLRGLSVQDILNDANKNPNGIWGVPWTFSCIHFGSNHVSPTAAAISGIFFGDCGMTTTVLAVPTNICFGLVSNHLDANHKWTAWHAQQDLTWKKTDLVGTQGPTSGNEPKITIEYKPGEYVRYYVNGILGYTETSQFALPLQGTDFAQEWVQTYVNSGTNAGGRLTMWFGNWNMLVKDNR